MMNTSRTISLAILFLVAPNISSAGTQTFTSNGSFSVPFGVSSLTADVIGGGGGGGGGTNEGAGGGGGGGGRSHETFAVTSDQILGVTVGVGGGHRGAPHCEGGASALGYGGGFSSIGPVIAYGGSGGMTGSGGGSGGWGSTNSGSYGGYPSSRWATTGGAGGTSGSGAVGGAGATERSCLSYYSEGSWTWCIEWSPDVYPQSGSAYGGGGGGVFSSGTCDTRSPVIYAGDGAPGAVTIYWTDPTFGSVNITSNISSSWTITGPSTITGSGTSQSSPSQLTGTYTIIWDDVPGYDTPETQSLTLVPGGTITFNGAYTVVITSSFSGRGCVLPAGGGTCNITAWWDVSGLPGGETVDVDVTGPGIARTYLNLPTKTATRALAAVITGLPSNVDEASPFIQSVSTTGTFTFKLLRHIDQSLIGTIITFSACPSGTSNVEEACLAHCVVAPWGSLPSGTSVTAHQTSTVTPPVSCVSQTRTCTNGTLSGSYAYATCNSLISQAVTITATPNRVKSGGSATISWSAPDVVSCDITKNAASWGTDVPSSGKIDPSIITQSTYTITSCKDANDNSITITNDPQVVVNVVPVYREF